MKAIYGLVCLLAISKAKPQHAHAPQVGPEDFASAGCMYEDVWEDGSKFPLVPWGATIELRQFNRTVYNVQGAILDENTVLAHFVYAASAPDPNSLSFKNYMVYVGQTAFGVRPTNPHNISYIKSYPGTQRKAPSKAPPNFAGFTLVYLSTPITFTPGIRPVCLPGKADTWLELENEYFSPNHTQKFVVGLNWQVDRDLEQQISVIKLRNFRQCEGTFPPEETDDEAFRCEFSLSVPPNVVVGHKVCMWRGIVALHSGGRIAKHSYLGFVGAGLAVYSPGSTMCDVSFRGFFDVPSPRMLLWIRQSVTCGPWRYACDNGQCIPLQLACNGQTDCTDFSDEDASYCRAFKPCNPNTEFVCSNYGDCIPRVSNVTGKVAATCDGFVDCPKGEDEEHCTQVSESTGIKPLVAALIGAAAVLLTLLPISFLVWRRLAAPYRDLTAAEVQEFQEGRSGEDTAICSRPYDTAYEYLGEECIRLHEIGRGNFGIVYLSLLGGQQVAEKVAKSDKMRVEAFLSLLTEVKIMQHIQRVGGHEGIVRFIGARTIEIKTRALSFAMEYCGLGNLQNYLVKNRAYFTEGSEPNVELHEIRFRNPDSLTVEVEHRFNYGDQLQWCRQIASAMNFLESQHIAHGDLAARNILLDKQRKAKLSDFGLAVQVEVGGAAATEERGQREFPWKWAAPEVLESKGKALSMKSDVWSFGVLLWEVFSLGLEPWAELQLPNGPPDLLLHLQSGALLGKPERANDHIYALMCSCWKLGREERPNFQTLWVSLELMCQELYEVNSETEEEAEATCSTSNSSANGNGQRIIYYDWHSGNDAR